jgi:hypothetical protein
MRRIVSALLRFFQVVLVAIVIIFAMSYVYRAELVNHFLSRPKVVVVIVPDSKWDLLTLGMSSDNVLKILGEPLGKSKTGLTYDGRTSTTVLWEYGYKDPGSFFSSNKSHKVFFNGKMKVINILKPQAN